MNRAAGYLFADHMLILPQPTLLWQGTKASAKNGWLYQAGPAKRDWFELLFSSIKASLNQRACRVLRYQNTPHVVAERRQQIIIKQTMHMR